MRFLTRLFGRKEAAKPDIKLSMIGANIFTSAMNGEPVTGVVLQATVWNVGEPAAIVRWRLEILPLDVPFSSELSELPDTLALEGPARTVLRGFEALDKRLGTQRLGLTPFEGRLLFYSELPQETVLAPSTRLRLIAEDVYGTTYSAEQLLGAWNKQGARP